MKKLFFAALAFASLYALPSQALELTPANTIPRDIGNSNCEPGCLQTYFGVTGLQLLYKGDHEEDGSATESGSFAGSYRTSFSNSAWDPSAALIRYTGGASIACPSCYLAIKDGNHTPSYYFYDLSAWNGVEDLVLTGFWPQQGAISHVSIWGRGQVSVPEPGTLGLLGAGLLLIGLGKRRRAVATA